MSPRVATLHTPIPSGTRRASHLSMLIIILELDAAFHNLGFLAATFLQARPDSRNLHIRISIPRHFLISASFSNLLSHAQWTSMQQSCIHIYIHCLGFIHLSTSPGGTCRRSGCGVGSIYGDPSRETTEEVQRRSRITLYVVRGETIE